MSSAEHQHEPQPTRATSPSGMVGQTASFERRPEKRPTNKRSVLPIVVGVVAVAAIVVIALYVVPLFIPHPHDPHEDEANTPQTELVSGKEDESTSKSDSQPEAEPATTVEPEPVVDPEPEPEPEPDPEPEPEPQPDPEPTPATPSYNTSETPVIGEFTSWFSNDLMNGNAPAFITRITDLSLVLGGWKAYIYNYAVAGNEYSQPSEELLNVYISGTEAKVALTFDWYYTRIGDGSVYENSGPDSTYSGTWSNGTVDALGAGSVRLTDFWEQDGHQYAIGRLTWPDAVDGTIALVRP